jgi:hypothetical protein
MKDAPRLSRASAFRLDVNQAWIVADKIFSLHSECLLFIKHDFDKHQDHSRRATLLGPDR